ncbi:MULTISPECIES: DUF1284 domain-containing protein [unclassified Rhizobium]|uniref:DUF1284 domain-containing protein n=1 Tax=unclassified Rhizobium TaxID=2613769 RepID=UPI00161A50B7|nr:MULTISPECIES: DUF1284 domain-containing protein [unclassified Rhizobium]MBB3382972.1 hypothetical protein [Rhizobium sp. BK098]MBB3614673.1 hypothetical protein [Rhizobium sp. BK609]MBB3679940.1 hypothetical protein [Rhizobium sp. BK612]
MTVRLRAHHLLCMLTFVGEGYTSAFTDNYRRIAERLSDGEDIKLVSGPDDICAPLLGEEEPHCLKASVIERDAVALADISTLLGEEIGIGAVLVPDASLLAKLRRNFAGGEIRHACLGCEWGELCSRIAATNFSGVLIKAA